MYTAAGSAAPAAPATVAAGQPAAAAQAAAGYQLMLQSGANLALPAGYDLTSALLQRPNPAAVATNPATAAAAARLLNLRHNPYQRN